MSLPDVTIADARIVRIFAEQYVGHDELLPAYRATSRHHMNLAVVSSGQLNGRHRNMYTVATSTVAHAPAIIAISLMDGGSMCRKSIRNGTVKYLQQQICSTSPT